jgi:hypothetical protein
MNLRHLCALGSRLPAILDDSVFSEQVGNLLAAAQANHIGIRSALPIFVMAILPATVHRQ